DESRIAIVPMGFCYPGVDGHGGDLPPRKECAPLWHARVLRQLPNVTLTLLGGSYAQRHYLDDHRSSPMTNTRRAWRDFGPRFVPLPHPSWRNTAWLRRNPWFENELLPELRERMQALLHVRAARPMSDPPPPRSAPCRRRRGRNGGRSRE